MSFLVQFILHKYLDKFFYGIDKKNIEAGILDGRITISNIGLQQNLLQNLNFPIKINYSYVQKVELHIPWRSEQTPVNIYISNIYALISAKDKNVNVYDIFMRKKQKALKEGIEAFLQSLKEESKNEKQSSRILDKIKKLLYNINLNIGCLHFRYEAEPQKSGTDGFSFGLKINNINLYNVNKEGKKQFFNYQKSAEKIIRGHLSIDFIGLYVNSKQNKFIFRKNLSKATQQKIQEKNGMNKKEIKQASKRDYAYITNEMRHISFPQKLSNSSTVHQQLHYILVISVKTLVSYNLLAQEQSAQELEAQNLSLVNSYSNVAVISGEIEFPSVSFKITQDQYCDIKKTIDFFSSFQAYWKEYVSQKNLVIVKEKNYVDISILLKQKKKKTQLTPKQKYELKNQCRKYLKWVFLTVYQERLKRSFLVQALKKDVTLENLLENKKICKIIKKINEDKLKNWVMQAMNYRKKFVEASSIFQRYSQTKIKEFLNKLIGTFQNIFYRKQEQQKNLLSIKDDIFTQKPYEYEFSIKINLLTFEVSKMDKFGVEFLMRNLRSEFLKRKQNYSFEVRIQDLEANVFSNKYGQKHKTIVPIIRKSIIQSKQVDLLFFKYEKSPLGSLYVNAECELDFESIEITIYPQAFKQFYQILFSNPQKSSQTETKKKKTVHKKTTTSSEPEYNQSNEFPSPHLLLRNKLKGKIRSPWIILPLGRNNNPQKQCWVVRLGDFNLETPQIEGGEVYKQKQNLYQKYKLELKQFELNFFSSVKFFYNWLKFNQNEESLFSIPYYKNMKIINMIKPFTCSVDFSKLKGGLPPTTKTKNYQYISHIHIQGIQIFLSNFLLEKLKQRIDIIGQEQNYEDFEFIEQNIENIYEQHVISGWAKVTNQKWKQMKFFVVLKGHFLYYFISENQKKYYFFTDVRKTMIRLVGRFIEKINPEVKDQKVSIFLEDPSMLTEWKKHITFCLQKKQKKTQEKKQSQDKKNELMEQTQLSNVKDRHKAKQVLDKMKRISSRKSSTHQPQHTSSSSTKISLSFIMNRLQIKLKDKEDKQFLLCYFKKSNFTYSYLYSRQAAFSLSSWDVFESYEHKEKEIPFLSSKKFYKSDDVNNSNLGRSSNINLRQDSAFMNQFSKERNNFLEVKIEFSSITNELSDISVNIDKLFIAWKVDLITKILAFFFYSAEMGDAPTPYKVEKRTLGIIFKMNKFYCYAYQGKQLAGLIKIHDATIEYYQSSIQEYFDVRFVKLQIDQSINNSLDNRQNMFISKGPENPFKLKYHIRKTNYKKKKDFQPVENLKAQFGQDTIVSMLTCELQDSIVVFQHQLTFRMLNYVLSHVLGTVAAKFKKRSYSPKYIYEVLKMQKITTMDIKIKSFTFVIPPHNKNQNHLLAEINEFRITKNLNINIPQLRPRKVTIPTKFDPVNVFFETMNFQFMNVKIFQRFGKEIPVPINHKGIDFRLSISKVNLSSDFYNVLEHYDDFDRLSVMKIQFLDELTVEVPKITFVTILQIFYQNIKQRDGRAQLFQPSLPYPHKKQYLIQFPTLKANLYEYNQKEKKMQVFNSFKLEKFTIIYTNYGTNSQMGFSSTLIKSEGQMPIDIWTAKKERMFTFKMISDSTTSVTKIELSVKGYQLDFCFDKLHNLLEFIHFDSDQVSNKKMPHKPSSFMCVNVFANDCLIKLEELWATGEFFVTYTKSAKNNFQKEILKYLQVENEQIKSNQTVKTQKSHKNEAQPISEDIADKEIKVDGENIKLTIKGDTIGEISSLYFHRLDLSAKKSMKRYKKQIVQIGQAILSIQLSDLQRIHRAYDKRIKKSPEFVLKNFFQPWNALPHKSSYTEKRVTEVEFSRINAFLVPNQKKNPLFYLMAEVRIPKLLYCTLGKEQEIFVEFGATFSQLYNTLHPQIIGQVKKIKLNYKNHKQKASKEIQIGNANQLNFYLSNLNSESLYILSQQIATLSPGLLSSSKTRKYLNFNYLKSVPIHSYVTVNNTTSYEITLQVANLSSITVKNFKQHQQKLNYQQLLELFIDQQATITLSIGNKKNVFKQKMKDIRLNIDIQIADQMIVKFCIENDSLIVHLFESCIIKNNTKLFLYIFSAEDKQFKLNSGQEKGFILVDSSVRRQSATHLNIHKRTQKILISLLNLESSASRDFLKDKAEQISLKNEGEQQIFNGLILVKKVKKNGLLTIQLKQKFILSNFTPFDIHTGNDAILKYKDQVSLSHGLYSDKKTKCSAACYPILVNGHEVQLCLKKCPGSFQVKVNFHKGSQKSSKIRNQVSLKKSSVKIYVKEIKSQSHQCSRIFLYTKIIYQSLAVETIILSGNTQPNTSKQEISLKGFKMDHEQEITLQEDSQYLFVENILTEKSEMFDLQQLTNSENKSQSSKQTVKCIYGSCYYLIQQKINLLSLANLLPKQRASLKDQMIQTRIKISDCWSIANITSFLVKIKGGVDLLSEQENKEKNKNGKLTKEKRQFQDFSLISNLQVHSNSQKSIPNELLLSSKDSKSLAPFLEVCFMDLRSQVKFYREIKISQPNISYIEVGIQICKVTVIVDKKADQKSKEGKEKQGLTTISKNKTSKWLRIILELSDEGYKVQNNLGDIVVEVKNGDARKRTQKLTESQGSKKISKDISYISDDYQIQEDLSPEPNNHQILVQPSSSEQLGIKSFSSQGAKFLVLSFYYPLRNIDFKQSLILELDNPASLAKKQIFLTDPSKKSSFTILVMTQLLKEGKCHIKLYKKSLYEESIPQKLKFTLKEFRLSLYVGQIKNTPQFQEEKIKLQLCNLEISREKHIDIQNFDVKLSKILLIEGSTLPIIAALDKKKHFLNIQAILQKAPQGLKGKSICVKINPFQINGRQGIILKLLEKIARIRSYKAKGNRLQSLMPKSGLRGSMQLQRITNLQFSIPEQNIQKEWESLKKGSKPISLEMLQVVATSIFLSYTKSQEMLSNSPFLSDPILKYFLLLPSIGETKLPIPDFEIKNFNGVTKQLLSLIAKELKSTIGQSILYSLTSLSLFDNPIQAVDDLVRYMMTILQTL